MKDAIDTLSKREEYKDTDHIATIQILIYPDGIKHSLQTFNDKKISHIQLVGALEHYRISIIENRGNLNRYNEESKHNKEVDDKIDELFKLIKDIKK